MTDIKHMCTPARVYLVLSTMALLILAVQNIGNTDSYCLGSYECPVGSTLAVFIAKIIYIAFWTFILNANCKAGHTTTSCFFVLLPFVLFFVLLGLLLVQQGIQ